MDIQDLQDKEAGMFFLIILFILYIHVNPL